MLLTDLVISNDKLCEGAYSVYLETSATEIILDKADHKNLLFVLLKEYSGMKSSVRAILTIHSYYSYSLDLGTLLCS